MKRLWFMMLLAVLLTVFSSAAFAENEETGKDWETLTDISIQIEDRSYEAVLYDNAAGKFMAKQLPFTIHLEKGEIDYLGATDLEFENKGFDAQNGYQKGELLYYRGWFIIILDEKLPLTEDGDYLPFGRLKSEEDADELLKIDALSADGLIAEDEKEENDVMKMMIGNTAVNVVWENNESVEALKALTADKPLVIQMSMYGGFEQVGAIGQSLPRSDVQTVTNAGDIVLYSGNQIVVFYGSNSWAYTRLGHISDKTAQEMAALLGNGNVTITISR